MDDPYYQTLPFTLNEEQLEYDFVVFGTNLQTSMYAAHMAKIKKKKGLMLQLQKGYSSDIRTLSLKELHEFMTAKGLSQQTHAPLDFKSVLPQELMLKNVDEVNKRKQTSKGLRGYNIDLQPRLFMGSSFACQMLKQANMDQYMDFRVVKKVLFLLNGKLQQVPLNLKTILNAKGLSLFERKDLFKGVHQLVKIYYKFHNVEVDNNSTNQFDKDTDVNPELYAFFCEQKDKFCQKFLMKVLNNKQKLYNMVMFGICGYQHKRPPKIIQEQYSCQQMLKRFGRFVKSCGVYSETPYLYVDNGIGDIPQAYCRISSIFGTIAILHPKVEINNIKKIGSDGYQIQTNLSPGEKIKTKEIKYTEPYFEYLNPMLQIQQKVYKQKVLRVVLINKVPENFKHQGPLIIHIFQNTSFVNTVTCLLFDRHSSSTPNDQYLLHFVTVLDSQEEQHIQSQIQALLSLAKQIFEIQETIYVAAYVQTNTYVENYGQNMIKNDWNIDLQRVTQYFKEMAGNQQRYFKDDSMKQNNLEEDDGYYQGLLKRLDNLKQKKEEKFNQQKDIPQNYETQTGQEQENNKKQQIVPNNEALDVQKDLAQRTEQNSSKLLETTNQDLKAENLQQKNQENKAISQQNKQNISSQ